MNSSEESITSRDVITYIFPDFNAVNYFKTDFVANNEFHVMEEAVVSGIDIYLVEQWANNRKISTIISTFTGNPKTKVSTVRFTVLKKPSRYYPTKFQEYLNELMLNNANVKRMEKKSSNSKNRIVGDEVLFVTNITSLPSNLNLINIENGDSRSINNYFMLNSNLKKLHCGGRSMSLVSESATIANEEKFRNMYKIINPKVPLNFAVKELINLIQICLFYFDLLDARYCDGFLCNITEEAILSWWNSIGLPHYSIKPNSRNGILSQRSVAGIFSFLISVKLRLQLIGGCDVPKDPFDFENFMISIGQFQKQYKLEKKRKLDLETLNKLFSITNASLLPNQGNSFTNASSGLNTFEEDLSPDNSSLNPFTVYSPNSPKTATLSSYRKNKNFYSKELKKLTNVVKYTVQDHISAVNRDENLNAQKVNGIKRGIKTKHYELSPLDVETLDLELFVRNYLIGKRLTRLFYGNLTPGGDSEPNSKISRLAANKYYNNQQNNSPYNNYNNSQRSIAPDKHYNFISFKDEISGSSNSVSGGFRSDFSRRGFNKMKLGLSSKRNGIMNKSQKAIVIDSNDKEIDSKIKSNALVDSLLQINDSNTKDDQKSEKECQEVNMKNQKNPKLCKKFCNHLNRRNSFPILINKGQINLNFIAFNKNQNQETSNKKHCNLKRSASFSLVENFVFQRNTSALKTEEKASLDFIRSLIDLDRINFKRVQISATKEKDIINTFGQLNMEMMRIKNAHVKMKSKKASVIDEDLMRNLDFKINDLSGIIDRLFYEAKIVSKRINELEDSTNKVEKTLKSKCTEKLSKYVENITKSKVFYEAYTNDEERQLIVLQLTGKKEESSKFNTNQKVAHDANVECTSIFQFFIFCINEFLIWIFQLVKFDRRRMDLERIRSAWAKLDPNRQYIEKAYTFLGRESTHKAKEN